MSAPLPENHRRFEPWPIAIVAFFVVFISTLATFAVFATRQRTDLVRKDYYEEEIRYQRQLDRLARTREVGAKLEIQSLQSPSLLHVRIPSSHAAAITAATLELYRPSDARLDRLLPFAPGPDGQFTHSLADLPSGPWKARIRWTHDGMEYCLEESFTLITTADSPRLPTPPSSPPPA